MSPNTIRMNITLPADVAEALARVAGPRKRSQFVAEAVQDKIDELASKRLQKTLKEGYLATKEEGKALAEEFAASDLEGWDEY